MLSKNKLKKFFSNPVYHANDIIQDQLEKMEKVFNHHLETGDELNALAIYQEYKEWVDAEDGETYGFMLLEHIANYTE